MGFYLRKSVSVGPFRFNFSKSGIGVSAGVRGFRVGTGPRGNYVHMGAGGLYYRATLPAGEVGRRTVPEFPQPSIPTSVDLEEIESADVAELRESSADHLLDEFEQKQRLLSLWPIAAGATAILAISGLAQGWPTWVTFSIVVVGVAATALLRVNDELRKTVVLFYDLEPDAERVYDALHDAFDALMNASAVWHVEASGDVEDRKRNAGASQLVRRKRIVLGKTPPSYVKTNVAVPAIPVGRQVLYFFPDRILVFHGNRVGAVSYASLDVARETTRFIESQGVPQDSQVVDRTWKYVNKKGGPDRRLKDNQELPIVLYEELHLRSTTGLNELCQISRVGASEAFERILASRALASLGTGPG